MSAICAISRLTVFKGGFVISWRGVKKVDAMQVGFNFHGKKAISVLFLAFHYRFIACLLDWVACLRQKMA